MINDKIYINLNEENLISEDVITQTCNELCTIAEKKYGCNSWIVDTPERIAVSIIKALLRDIKKVNKHNG